MRFFLLLLVLLGLVSGCGKEPEVEVILMNVQIEQARADIYALDQVTSEGGRKVDQLGGNLYSQIFGGTETRSIRTFFNDRVHYLVDVNRTRERIVGKFDNLRWLTPEPAPTDPLPNGTPAPAKPVRIAGVNIGIIYWLNALVNDAEVTLIDQDGRFIPIVSSRTGVIGVGPAYGTSRYQLSRQSVLIHEARHSDCTGGISETQVNILRNAKHEKDWVSQIPVMTCGHLHVECKKGEFAGIPACDGELFGAYGVGAVFSLGQYFALRDREVAREEQEEMKMRFFDQIDRLEMVEDIDAYFQGQFSEKPDMSSSSDPGLVVR